MMTVIGSSLSGTLAPVTLWDDDGVESAFDMLFIESVRDSDQLAGALKAALLEIKL